MVVSKPKFSGLWSGSWTYNCTHNSMPYGTCHFFCHLHLLIYFKWSSSYGNTVVATTKPKDGQMRRTGTSSVAINSLGPIVLPAPQNVFGKRLSVTSNAGNLRRHPGWSGFAHQMKRQHIMLCFSSLFTRVRSFNPRKLFKILIWKNSIDATVVSRFRGWRWVVHSS